MENKNKNNSSNSLVFGRWAQTKRWYRTRLAKGILALKILIFLNNGSAEQFKKGFYIFFQVMIDKFEKLKKNM